MTDLDVPCGDSRTLCVRQAGDIRGKPIFFLHGTPGARVLFRPHVRWAEIHGVRLIAYDRPGYGNSTACPGRTMAAPALEVETIASSLGLDRYAVFGYSGGGAPALACAALSPDRTTAAVAGAALAPFDAAGLDWMGSMSAENRDDLELLASDRVAWENKSQLERQVMLTLTPEMIRANFGRMAGYTDTPSNLQGLAEFLCDTIREGLRPGVAGVRDDALAQISPWGFELGSISIPVQIWHGETDHSVPVEHGRWLASHVPGARAHILPGLGHPAVFVRHSQSMLEWLRSSL